MIDFLESSHLIYNLYSSICFCYKKYKPLQYYFTLRILTNLTYIMIYYFWKLLILQTSNSSYSGQAIFNSIHQAWQSSASTCWLYSAIHLFPLSSEIVLTLLIGFERLLALKFPQRYNSVTPRSILKLAITLSLVIPMPLFLG